VSPLYPSGDHNVFHHQKDTFHLMKRPMEAIVFTMHPWPIISDVKHWMVDEDWQLAIEVQDCQSALAGVPVNPPSVRQLPGVQSLIIDPNPENR